MVVVVVMLVFSFLLTVLRGPLLNIEVEVVVVSVMVVVAPFGLLAGGIRALTVLACISLAALIVMVSIPCKPGGPLLSCVGLLSSGLIVSWTGMCLGVNVWNVLKW